MKYFFTHVIPAGATWDDGLEDRLGAWLSEMDQRGIYIDGARLEMDAEAVSVRGKTPDAVVTDGPYAETKELVAGFDLIDARDLDEALAAAAAHPTTEAGAIEVRPVAPGMPTPPLREPDEGAERYLMLVCWDQSDDDEIPAEETPRPDEDDPMGPWIAAAGRRRLHGWQLQPPSLATTVRRAEGRATYTDGPFAESKEQIGGYDLLETSSRDEAIAIAASHGAGTRDLRRVYLG